MIHRIRLAVPVLATLALLAGCPGETDRRDNQRDDDRDLIEEDRNDRDEDEIFPPGGNIDEDEPDDVLPRE